MSRPSALRALHDEIRECRRCPSMIGPVVLGEPVRSKVMLVGQAPGVHEGELGRPFAWTAGKTLFRWFASIGVDEVRFRGGACMAAVCRCFPGKASGGDRAPSVAEVGNCAPWLDRELALVRPELVLPVGKLAIAAVLGEDRPLVDTVGTRFSATRAGRRFDAIPLPHPSGASTWFKRPPGSHLLEKALAEISSHPAWLALSA